MRAALPLLGVLTLVWGTSWVMFPLALREVSVWTLRAVNTTGAGLALLLVARWRGDPITLPRSCWGTVTAAAIGYICVWNIATAYATVMIPTGQAAVLGFTMPLWAALIGAVFFRHRLGRNMVIALLLGVAGVGLLAMRGMDAYAHAPLGFLAGIVAAIGWAIGTLVIKRRPPPVPTLVLTAWQLLIAAVPLGIAALWFAEDWFVPSLQTVLAIVYVTLVPMALGNVVWFSIVGLLPAHVAGLTSVLVPAVAMLTGAIVLGEPLGWAELLAMACSAGAVALALRASPAKAQGRQHS